MTARLRPSHQYYNANVSSWTESFHSVCGLVAVVSVLPSPYSQELLLDGGTFVMRLSAELFVVHTESRSVCQ